MNLQRIEQSLNPIASEASFVLHINSKAEHEQALTLMEQLIEDYDKHEPLIDLLCIMHMYFQPLLMFLKLLQQLSF